jgi:hypothetical protein
MITGSRRDGICGSHVEAAGQTAVRIDDRKPSWLPYCA